MRAEEPIQMAVAQEHLLFADTGVQLALTRSMQPLMWGLALSCVAPTQREADANLRKALASLHMAIHREDTAIEDLNASDKEKVEKLVATMDRIDEHIDATNLTLTGAMRMLEIGQTALEALPCECDPGDGYGGYVSPLCTRCRALTDMASVAREFST